MLRDCLYSLGEWFTNNSFSISDVLDLFELISIILLLGYILLDVRHKANGYSEIRVERFKELFQMEEKLLNILRDINYALEANIDIIVERKRFILQSGAKCLTGKECTIYDGKIEYTNENHMRNCSTNDLYFQLINLQEMSEEFRKLVELDEELKSHHLVIQIFSWLTTK